MAWPFQKKFWCLAKFWWEVWVINLSVSYCVVGLEGTSLLWAHSGEQNNLNIYFSKLNHLNAAVEKYFAVILGNVIFLQDNANHISLVTRQKFSLIYYIHLILHIQITILRCLYRIFLMQNISVLRKTAKTLRTGKNKIFGRMELWSCLQNSKS